MFECSQSIKCLFLVSDHTLVYRYLALKNVSNRLGQERIKNSDRVLI
jgi:hypothetical protein